MTTSPSGSSDVLFPEAIQHLLGLDADTAKHSKGSGTVGFPDRPGHVVRNEREDAAASGSVIR